MFRSQLQVNLSYAKLENKKSGAEVEGDFRLVHSFRYLRKEEAEKNQSFFLVVREKTRLSLFTEASKTISGILTAPPATPPCDAFECSEAVNAAAEEDETPSLAIASVQIFH